MDASTFSFVAIAAVLSAACVLAFLGYLNAMRRAGSESRRRLIARSAIITWAVLALLVPAMMLSALGVLPRWICGIAIVVASVIGLLAARYARRSTMRMHSLG